VYGLDGQWLHFLNIAIAHETVSSKPTKLLDEKKKTIICGTPEQTHVTNVCNLKVQ